MHFPDGSLFEGEFIEGVPVGQGRFVRPNGDYFEGEIKAGRANGKGLYVTNNLRFTGMFQDDKPHGQGEETNEQFTFTGLYERGLKKSGLLTWREGKYLGEFMRD
jgi:hypothetical protein